MLFAKVADGIACQAGCGLWSDVITISGRWNSHLKGGLTIKNLLMALKDKDHILKKVQSYTDIDVIGSTVMQENLGNQQEHMLRGSDEHLNALCSIHGHSNRSGHYVTLDKFSIVGREDQDLH